MERFAAMELPTLEITRERRGRYDISARAARFPIDFMKLTFSSLTKLEMLTEREDFAGK